MFRLDFAHASQPSTKPGASSPKASPPLPRMTNGSESAILKGHKLSPTAPRYGQTLEHKGRCPSIESLHVDSAHPLHLAVFSSAASAPDLQCILKKEEKKELPPKKAVAKIEPPRFEMVREEDSLLSSEIALNGLTSLHLN